MDIRKVKKLIELLEESGIAEIEIKEGEESVRISRMSSGATTQHFIAAPMAAPAMAAPSPVAAPAAAPPAAATRKSNEYVVTAPMVGTFYASSAPGAKPFVQIGDEVKVGQVLCIIEAMKMMNEIHAEVGGRIVGIAAENGAPVEYGSPLFLLAPLE